MINAKFNLKKLCIFIFGIFLYALSFNLFYAPYNIIIGGSTGLSLIFREWIGISPSLFVAIVSYTMIVFSFIYLGKSATLKTIIGTILYPIFLELTSWLAIWIDVSLSSTLLTVIYGGFLIGIANGIMLKTGFTTGGFNVIYQIVNKYLKISIGNSILAINIVILVMGTYVFGLCNTLYAIIALYISSVVADRVIIGVSNAKAFYIVTNKEKEVKELIFKELGYTVTELSAKGGYTNKNKKMLMCVVPTKEYFILKEAVMELDKGAFFLITDTYEVSNNVDSIDVIKEL